MNGELNAVVARGTAIVPALTRALEGPPDSVTVTLARSTGESFSAMRTQFDRESPADQALRPLGDSTEYVRTALANFRRAYQIRAAVALHAINPTNARVLFRRYIVADSTGAARALDPVLRRQLDSLVNTPP